MPVSADSIVFAAPGLTSVEVGSGGVLQLLDNGYAPSAAPLNSADSSATPPFADMRETMTLVAADPDQADVLTEIARLTSIAEYVQAFDGDELDTAAPTITYKIKDSALTGGVTFILRDLRIAGPRDFKALPHLPGSKRRLVPISAEFTRRGWLLGAAEQKTGTFTYPTPLQLDFTATSQNLLSPLQVALLMEEDTGATEGYLIIAADDAYIKHAEAESFSTISGSPASTARSGSSGGNVLRATTTYAIKKTGFGFTKPGAYAVLIKADNDSTGDYSVKATGAALGYTGAVISSAVSPTTVIKSSKTTCHVHHCGTLFMPRPLDYLRLDFTNLDGVSGNFDVDDVIVVYLHRATRILWHNAMDTENGGTPDDAYLYWDARPLTATAPAVYLLDADSYYDFGAMRGDLLPVGLSSVAVFWYSCDDNASNFLYSGAAFAHGVAITRYPAYLLPE